MTADDEEVRTTAVTGDASASVGTATALRILVDGVVASHELPARGTVIIGRGPQVDVHVEHPSISRRHAALHIGPPLRVEDLGSVNGTRKGGQALGPHAPADVSLGEPMGFGSVLAVLQSVLPPDAVTEARKRVVRPREAALPLESAMDRLGRLVDRVAATNMSILIRGETGVGKEVLAETIHRRSLRADKQLLRLNCAALSPNLIENEIFGHERGAFTGAQQAKPGLLELATGGSVFLDEIGDTPLDVQAKLLRVLEDRTVTRVGGTHASEIDVRFISATHRDLDTLVAQDRFRMDLFFRLNGMTLAIPPLRERLDEIPELSRQLIADACRKSGRRLEPELSPEALRWLSRRTWPGNIRELRNVIERVVLLCGGGLIEPHHLVDATTPEVEAPGAAAELGLRDEIASLERGRILDTMARCGGNQTRAAKILGMRRQTLLARLDKYGVPRPRKS